MTRLVVPSWQCAFAGCVAFWVGLEVEALIARPSLFTILFLLVPPVIAAYLLSLGLMNAFTRSLALATGWRRFLVWCQIVFVAPLCIYVTVAALLMTYTQWFGQGARE